MAIGIVLEAIPRLLSVTPKTMLLPVKLGLVARLMLTIALTVMLCASCISLILLRADETSCSAKNSDVLMRWLRVLLTFKGPETSETADPNPCFNYRLDVTFHGADGQQITVSGFCAADRNAVRTGAQSGNNWRTCFSPNVIGLFFVGPVVTVNRQKRD